MCADYKSANSREAESGKNEDESSGEDEGDSDQTNIKTEKVRNCHQFEHEFCSHLLTVQIHWLLLLFPPIFFSFR